MAYKDLNVYRDANGEWHAKRQGGQRASVVGQTQKEVFEAARELAKKSGSEVSIHRADTGRIRTKHSYGNDPKSTKG